MDGAALHWRLAEALSIPYLGTAFAISQRTTVGPVRVDLRGYSSYIAVEMRALDH